MLSIEHDSCKHAGRQALKHLGLHQHDLQNTRRDRILGWLLAWGSHKPMRIAAREAASLRQTAIACNKVIDFLVPPFEYGQSCSPVFGGIFGWFVIMSVLAWSPVPVCPWKTQTRRLEKIRFGQWHAAKPVSETQKFSLSFVQQPFISHAIGHATFVDQSVPLTAALVCG